MDTTYDVRVYKTEVYRGKRTSSHTVRWKTAHRAWRRTFRNAAQADVFRAELLAAAARARPSMWLPVSQSPGNAMSRA